MTDFCPISSMIIIFDAPALVYRLRRLISRHKSRIVIDIPAYIYIFHKIAHYDLYLIASNCFYYISIEYLRSIKLTNEEKEKEYPIIT